MSNKRDALEGKSGGFLARQHQKLRFTELSETFFGRVILAKCPDPSVTTPITVQLSLCDLFRRGSPEELEEKLKDVKFASSPKMTEISADLLSAVFGVELRPHTTTESALDFYQKYIASRLQWLKSGDKGDDRLPCIEDFTPRANGKLINFEIVVRPATLRDRLGEYIPAELELTARLLQKLDHAPRRPADPGPRIDNRKEVELLNEYLDERQELGKRGFRSFQTRCPSAGRSKNTRKMRP